MTEEEKKDIVFERNDGQKRSKAYLNEKMQIEIDGISYTIPRAVSDLIGNLVVQIKEVVGASETALYN